MNDMFGSEPEADGGAKNARFMSDLLSSAQAEDGAIQMQKILEANAGRLGIDFRTRNYYILDGVTGAVLAESDETNTVLASTPNLLSALNGQVGDLSELTAKNLDEAFPISGGDNRYIIYILDNRDTVSNLNAQLFTIIMQALVIGLLIAVLFSYLLSKTLVGPIEKVTEGAEKLAGGDFGNKLPVLSPDEIGILTGTFNHMADVLQDSINAVENERNKLDTLFLHMTDGVVAFDHDGSLIHCNPAACHVGKGGEIELQGLFPGV
jgi:two-component system sensor histidine kinase VicK